LLVDALYCTIAIELLRPLLKDTVEKRL